MDWRRDVACLEEHSRKQVQISKEGVEHEEPAGEFHESEEGCGPRKHDCSIDCDYPSQCLHERYAALKEYLAAEQGSSRELEQAWEDMESDLVLYADGNEYD